MNNGDMPINATSPNKRQSEWAAARAGGLTKREYFAGLAMQGFIAAGCITKDPIASAVIFADELLMRLEK